MTKRHWRETVEIVGVVAIVASLLLLASEVRQSNRIATAQAELLISDAYDKLNTERASNPDFAKLFPKLEAPSVHLTTATEASQIQGIVRHYVNVLWSVNNAYEGGLLERGARDRYIRDFANTLAQWPGIRSHFVEIYVSLPPMQTMDVFAPVAEYLPREQEAPQ